MFIHTSTVCCHIFMHICNWVSGGLDHGSAPGFAGSSLWPKSDGVVDIVRGKPLFLKFFGSEIFGQLVDNGTYDLHVRQFFCTCIGKEMAPEGKWGLIIANETGMSPIGSFVTAPFCVGIKIAQGGENTCDLFRF